MVFSKEATLGKIINNNNIEIFTRSHQCGWKPAKNEFQDLNKTGVELGNNLKDSDVNKTVDNPSQIDYSTRI